MANNDDGVNVARTDEIAEAVLARVAKARTQLAEAAVTADMPGIAAALDELEEAYGQARSAKIAVPRVERDGTGR
ncbi:hypothetical protein [Catenulispora rubra]|uniref:hypothetical protein n=1 Tax=Catenulispora rubra TaxID=280293 RepID=UPI0018924220|nr:hypothetical protein [Catenulispora rubra]